MSTLKRTWAGLLLLTLLIAVGCGSASELDGGRVASGGSAGFISAGFSGLFGVAGQATAGRGGSAGGALGGAGGALGSAGAAGSTPTAPLVSIALTPPVASVAVGTQLALRATATYADKTTQDVTASAAWASSGPEVKVSQGVVSGVSPGTATVTATLAGQSASAKVTVPNATVQSLTVTPTTATTGISGTIPFHAVVTLSDATTQDVTATATWSSSSPAIAIVASSGVARGVAAGMTTIRASVGAVSGTAALTVTSAKLSSIALTPTNPGVAVGVKVAFIATGTFSDGSVSDVSSGAVWASSDSAVAALDATTHQATSLAPGATTISATVAGVTGTTVLTVTSATLSAIQVTPPTSKLAINGSAKLVATGTYSDNTTVDLTASVTWSTSNASLVQVSNAAGAAGTIAGLSAGTATITATLDNVSGTASVTVTAANLVSIAISPENPTLPLGTTVALVATGTYSDATVVDISSSVTWSIDDSKVATISNAQTNPGLVTASSVGATKARATLGTISGTTALTVTAAKLVSLTVTPANPSVPAGTSQALIATAMYSDNSSVVVTTTAVWSSSAATVATVSNASGSQGQVTGVAAGTATITATLSGISGTTTVTVAAPTITQIAVSPIASSVRVGQTVRYTATAILSNNTQRDVTQQATWSSSNPATASVMRAQGGPGGGGVTGTALAVGSTTISAVYQGQTGSTTLTVSNATLTEVQVTPINPKVLVNGRQQLVATAIFSDNTQQVVTGQATWVSSAPAIAQVSTAGGMRGTATGLAVGSATISATYDGVTGSTALTVSAATVVEIQVTPVQPSVSVGTAVSFAATAIYSDNSTQNVTGQATWTSSTPTVAAISTANGSKGQAQALAEGSTTISATFAGTTGSTLLTVTQATLTAIQITPFSPTVLVGFNTNLTATGLYSDNTTRDLTAQVTWASSAQEVAAVSNAGGSRGLLTPLSAGKANISATYQGVVGNDAVVVSSATLSSITVSPGTATIANHTTQAFTALGMLSDSTTLDVSNYVTWLSTTPAIASISNANGSRGIATALTPGSVTISAVRGTQTGSATLTVQ
ncbi:MAG TPA: Ig-like domain-containing protein [Polyangiaceae bacterium]|nr:Ig-like domain-containing protein [Polyangiaceae bacterium]